MSEKDLRFPALVGPILDHEQFCRDSLTIRDKRGKPVPYLLQPAQRILTELIARQRSQQKPVRIIVLKARQVMISTGVAGHMFQGTAFRPGQKATIVAHTAQSTADIFSYYTQFDESYKRVPGGPAKLKRERDAPLSGMIGYQGGGFIRVLTANNLEGGRSNSLRFLHLSEYAFWRDARTLMTGLMQAVPDDPETMVVIESTANGLGGPFYEEWQKAMRGESDFIPMFFAWWQHPEYSTVLDDKVSFQASLSGEERELLRRYNLKLEQLHWRRRTIANKCQGSIDSFKQEYPSCPEEAFLLSGRPRFDHASLARMPVDNEPVKGELMEVWNGPKRTIAFLPNKEGALSLYRKPAPHKEYVIGSDVAEGIDVNLGKGAEEDPDWTVHSVFDRDTGEQVAKFRARIEPGAAGDYLSLLAEWYNWAFLVPEANGPGGAMIEVLIRNGYPPSLIFHRRPLPDEQFAADASNKMQFLGWKQNVATRPQLISTHDVAIRQLAVTFHDPNTLREHQTFIITARGRAEAQQGCHDDEVFAAALATAGILHPPPDRRKLLIARGQPPAAAPAYKSGVQRYGRWRQEDERMGRF